MHSLAPTVLLVDDSEDDRFLFERAHQKAGVNFQTKTASDGREALAYLKGEGIYTDRQAYPMPYLVILDVNMPALSGLEVLKWIRSMPTLKGLIIVMFTSSMSDKDVSLAYELGANSYLLKPVNATDLISAISLMEDYWIKLNLGNGWQGRIGSL